MTYITHRNLNHEPLFRNRGPALQHLDIELTERCNNACWHCFINLPQKDRKALERELSTDGWKDILRQAADLGALSVRFTGGEPLLRDDFAELYVFARRLGMKVRLYTNARPITPELADLFARIPPLEKIDVTVYGMHPETYDSAACAPGGYVEFRRGIALLLERGVSVSVKSALLPHNRRDWEEFEAWARTIPGMHALPAPALFFYQRARQGKPALRRRIQQVRMDPVEGVALLALRPGYRADTTRFCRRFACPMGDRLFTCAAGQTGSVDAYGIFQPCLMLRDPAVTIDLKTTSLKGALQSCRSGLPGMVATHPDYLRRCGHCFLRGLCESCPATSYAEHGRLDQPVDYFCRVAHAQARDLGLLGETENAWEVQDWKERLERPEKEFHDRYKS